MPIQIPYYDTIPFEAPGVIAIGDGQCKWEAPFDGEFLEYDGWIDDYGTGAGTSTDLQLRNETTGVDYFATKPTFEVDSATYRLEGGELVASPTFRQGDLISLDIDDIPGGANSEGILFRVVARLVREVTV